MTAVIVLMGVSGSGKTTVGEALSERLGWPFYDADDYHSPHNIAKMAGGEPLNDADRQPWLARLHELISTQLKKGQPAVLGASVLKQRYRDMIAAGNPGMLLVYLKGDYELIAQRMRQRSDHFFDAKMLRSQFDALEEPSNATIVDVDQPVDAIVDDIINQLNLSAQQA